MATTSRLLSRLTHRFSKGLIVASVSALTYGAFGTVGTFATFACGGGAAGSIGAILGRRDDGRVFVREVPSDMTGAKAGLEPGDEIVAIDGKDIHAMSRDDVSGALRGGIGTTVTLTIDRDGAKRDVKVERGPFQAVSPPPPR